MNDLDRQIILGDETGKVRAGALADLLACGFFPEDEASRAQFASLLTLESQRYQSSTKDYSTSEVFRAVETLLAKRTGQVSLAGYVGIVLSVMGAFGHSMNLRPAAQVVSDMVYRGDGKFYARAMAGELRIKSHDAPGDPDKIEAHFRKYRSVAHIHAARVACAEYADLSLHGMDRAADFEMCFFRTVAEFELRFREAPNFADWRLWSILPSFPRHLWSLPPLLPSFDVVKDLLGDEHFARIVESASINRRTG